MAPTPGAPERVHPVMTMPARARDATDRHTQIIFPCPLILNHRPPKPKIRRPRSSDDGVIPNRGGRAVCHRVLPVEVGSAN